MSTIKLKNITEEDAINTEVYICGGRKMIEDCKQILEEKKISNSRVHFENFF